MDARNLIGLSVFFIFIALVHYLIIDAIFKENQVEPGRIDPAGKTRPESETGRKKRNLFSLFALLKADRAG